MSIAPIANSKTIINHSQPSPLAQQLPTFSPHQDAPKPPSPPPTPNKNVFLPIESKEPLQAEEHEQVTPHQQANSAREEQQVELDEKAAKKKEDEITITKPKTKCPRCGAENYAGLCQSCFGGMDFR